MITICFIGNKTKCFAVRNIGVSNFTVSDLKILLKDANVTPAVNQVNHFKFVLWFGVNFSVYILKKIDLAASICLSATEAHY